MVGRTPDDLLPQVQALGYAVMDQRDEAAGRGAQQEGRARRPFALSPSKGYPYSTQSYRCHHQSLGLHQRQAGKEEPGRAGVHAAQDFLRRQPGQERKPQDQRRQAHGGPPPEPLAVPDGDWPGR